MAKEVFINKCKYLQFCIDELGRIYLHCPYCKFINPYTILDLVYDQEPNCPEDALYVFGEDPLPSCFVTADLNVERKATIKALGDEKIFYKRE